MNRATARVLLAALCLLSVAAGSHEWRERRRKGVLPSRRAASLVHADEWPSEPAAPAEIDPSRFASALRRLCGFMPPGRARRYADWILHYGRRHENDPFLLGGLIYRMSRCDPDAVTSEGIGLAAIQPHMYRENVRGRYLRYSVSSEAGEQQREVLLQRGLFERSLRRAEANIEWAAALLAMFREQHALIDARFEQVPHRHHVSHLIWGDRVLSARAEDRILTDRRRLLTYYGVEWTSPSQEWRGIAWQPPLDGGLRVVSGVLGDLRDGGERRHRGIDVESSFGEPVYAMADGVVSFAGVDLPRGTPNRQLSPEAVSRVPRRELGPGGRFVCVLHEGDGERWLRSCYMHLEATHVRQGDRVERGALIGTVGRTGMRSSAPHLHLELQSDNELFDARAVLDQLFLGDPPDPPRKRRRPRRAR